MKKSTIHNQLLPIITGVFVLFFSLAVEPYYIKGDQLIYNALYIGVKGLSIDEGLSYYQNNIDSKEFIHFLLIWISSNLSIDKIYFIALANSILAFLSHKFLARQGGNSFIVFIIIALGFYSLVLFFAAERLKFGFLFLLIGLSFKEKPYMSFLAFFFSIVTHVQMIMIYPSMILLKVKKDVIRLFKDFRLSTRFLLLLIVTVVFSILTFNVINEQVFSKFNSYFAFQEFDELFKISVFFIFSILYAKRKTDVFLFFIPLLFFVFIFGGSRVNFLGYFVFLYFSIHYRSGFNLGILLTSSYFLYTGILFINNIFLYGDGFQ